jgi:hypothetical protein
LLGEKDHQTNFILKEKKAAELVNQIPDQLLENLADDLEVDRQVSRLYGHLMVKLLLYGMFRSERLSTHILEELYNSSNFSAFSGKGGHETRHSSLAARLSTLDYQYFEAIFEWISDQFGRHLKVRPNWLNDLERFDSTMIAIGGGLVDWGMHVGRKPKEGERKVQLKISLGLKAWLPTSVKVFKEQKHLSEENALKLAIAQATRDPEDFIAFDQGMKSRKTFREFDGQNIGFVTRAHEDVRYEKIEDYRQIKGRTADGLRFLQDSKVYLYQGNDEIIEHPFRLIEVEVQDPEDGQPERLIFITNLWNFSAMDIARIYRRRWDIEVFFRFLKQELNMKHLINRTHNGIMIQLYAALMSAILLVAFKKINKIASYKKAKVRFEEQLLFSIFKELEEMPPPERLSRRIS